MRPNDLADELGIDGRRVRGWLRAVYPRPDDARGSSWALTEAQVSAARLHFAGQTSTARVAKAASVRSVEPKKVDGRDWFWEGNVVKAVVDYLVAEGWKIEFVANTAIKQQGDDIRATKAGRTLRVEVKGYPSVGYADPARAAETKRTSPSTQAGHWFSQALLHVIRDLGKHPADLVAIALPDQHRFRGLVAETEAPLKKLGVAVLLVGAEGKVDRRIG